MYLDITVVLLNRKTKILRPLCTISTVDDGAVGWVWSGPLISSQQCDNCDTHNVCLPLLDSAIFKHVIAD
jgi:hypothetical protein